MSIPEWSSSDWFRVTLPAESSSASKAPPAKNPITLRARGLIGLSSPTTRFVKLVKASGVQTAMQGSSHLTRTSPSENAARNLAGTLSLFFASSE